MKNLNVLKSHLEEKLDELRARATAVEDRLGQPAEADWEDNAVIVKNEEVLTKIDEATLSEIRSISLALSRIETGDYGTCATCSEAIPRNRLEALPYATECVACAAKSSH